MINPKNKNVLTSFGELEVATNSNELFELNDQEIIDIIYGKLYRINADCLAPINYRGELSSVFICKINKLLAIENLPFYIDKFSYSMGDGKLYVNQFPCDRCVEKAIIIRDGMRLCLSCMKNPFCYMAKCETKIEV